MKLIAFSLWGDNPKYNVGAIKNAELAKVVYPGWVCRFYVGASVPQETIDALEAFDNTEVVKKDEPGNYIATTWRFYPASENDVDVLISRDCDSRLNIREKAAVDEWLASDRGFHVMRDHPAHGIGILAGMWGCKKGAFPQMKELLNTHVTPKDNRFGIDQHFLCSIVEPLVRPNWMEHDAFFNISKRKFDKYCRGFPTPRDRKTMRFVGEPFDANDKSEIVLTQPGTD
jgi:protein O-GlcNAc transferase